jgi:tetratricopeptide (TPR) repeat protein
MPKVLRSLHATVEGLPMLATRRAGVLILLSVLCSLATSAFCGQQPPAGSAVPPSDVARLRQRLSDQQRELDRLAGHLEAIEQSTNTVTRASEEACKQAEHTMKVFELAAVVLTLILALLAFFGYRGWRDVIRKAEQHVKAAEELAKKAQRFVDGIEAFHRQAEEQVRSLPTVDLSKEMSPELKQSLEDIRTKLDLVEALGLPLDAEAYVARGIAYYSQKNYERALQCYDRALRIKPDYALAHSNRGAALGNLARYEEALAAFDRALQVTPDDAQAHYNRGVALIHLGRYEETLAACNRALQIKPDHAAAHFNRACAYSRLNRKAEALADLKEAIRLDPEYKEKGRTDPDFEGLRADPEFRRLVGLDDEPSV